MPDTLPQRGRIEDLRLALRGIAVIAADAEMGRIRDSDALEEAEKIAISALADDDGPKRLPKLDEAVERRQQEVTFVGLHHCLDCGRKWPQHRLTCRHAQRALGAREFGGRQHRPSAGVIEGEQRAREGGGA